MANWISHVTRWRWRRRLWWLFIGRVGGFCRVQAEVCDSRASYNSTLLEGGIYLNSIFQSQLCRFFAWVIHAKFIPTQLITIYIIHNSLNKYLSWDSFINARRAESRKPKTQAAVERKEKESWKIQMPRGTERWKNKRAFATRVVQFCRVVVGRHHRRSDGLLLSISQQNSRERKRPSGIIKTTWQCCK